MSIDMRVSLRGRVSRVTKRQDEMDFESSDSDTDSSCSDDCYQSYSRLRKSRSRSRSDTPVTKTRVLHRWTPEQHAMLERLVAQYGTEKKWAEIAAFIPGRSGKQCRERWLNHLREGLIKGRWTLEEEYILGQCHALLGSHWSQMVRRLPGRCENSIKNFWNATLRSKPASKKRGLLWAYMQKRDLERPELNRLAFMAAVQELRGSDHLPPFIHALHAAGRLCSTSDWETLFEAEAAYLAGTSAKLPDLCLPNVIHDPVPPPPPPPAQHHHQQAPQRRAARGGEPSGTTTASSSSGASADEVQASRRAQDQRRAAAGPSLLPPAGAGAAERPPASAGRSHGQGQGHGGRASSQGPLRRHPLTQMRISPGHPGHHHVAHAAALKEEPWVLTEADLWGDGAAAFSVSPSGPRKGVLGLLDSGWHEPQETAGCRGGAPTPGLPGLPQAQQQPGCALPLFMTSQQQQQQQQQQQARADLAHQGSSRGPVALNMVERRSSSFSSSATMQALYPCAQAGGDAQALAPQPQPQPPPAPAAAPERFPAVPRLMIPGEVGDQDQPYVTSAGAPRSSRHWGPPSTVHRGAGGAGLWSELGLVLTPSGQPPLPKRRRVSGTGGLLGGGGPPTARDACGLPLISPGALFGAPGLQLPGQAAAAAGGHAPVCRQESGDFLDNLDGLLSPGWERMLCHLNH